ncbi:MipA/OmpV family protein [Yoonia algicola]|uniref:MipA/OmpV family protein n=1 Tax=Yoonia algicola TaxID=3137368 RepID=A0AAN0M5X0_9RHOB
MLHRFIILALAVTAPASVMAQDNANGLSFRFGLGPSFAPEYFGSEDVAAGVAGKFQLERFQFGGLSVGGSDDYGLGATGSFRFIGARDADDFDALAGLEDIDASLEVGGGLEFATPDYDVFAVVRYGVVGHESFVAELGSNLYYRPTDQLTFKAGPRLLVGDDDYAQTYFGVDGAASLTDYTAQGGLISAGAMAEATYAINDDWEVIGTLQYDQLRSDAADSPITESDDQISGSIVLTRRITFGF